MKRRAGFIGVGRVLTVVVLLLLLAAVVALEACTESTGQPLWVKRYNGPGNGEDHSRAIAVDAAGNVYVTGFSVGSGTYRDYATIKFDSAGNELWVERYDGPANGDDKALAMAVDAGGNVYVTGLSPGSGTGLDYATIKYDSAGNRLWVARYNGPGNGDDMATAIAVDTSGNVYVTGRSTHSGIDDDYATIKYDSAGNRLWVARYNGLGGLFDDQAAAIAVDSAGNVYVTGMSSGSGTGFDYATIKYDSTGTSVWVRRYNGLERGNDQATAIAVDTDGNVYVTGASEGLGNTSDYATIKYDSAGTTLWAARYNGPGELEDEGQAMAVGSGGDVYVTGMSRTLDTGYDYATIKYNSAGNRLWVQRYNGPGNGDDFFTAIAIDPGGNVYVTGSSEGSGTDSDYATIKYDSAGNVLWVGRYMGPGNDLDGATAIAVDTDGNFYVTGVSVGSGTGRDYATIKYSR